jgi:hypothetical protein
MLCIDVTKSQRPECRRELSEALGDGAAVLEGG